MRQWPSHSPFVIVTVHIPLGKGRTVHLIRLGEFCTRGDRVTLKKKKEKDSRGREDGWIRQKSLRMKIGFKIHPKREVVSILSH